jgi:molybdopterin converting factor small subunit
MPEVRLRAPLSELCGGGRHVVAGTTVSEALHALEAARPSVAGWIMDERGRIREHINVYVNGEGGDASTTVADGDCIYVLPAITGG